MSDPTGSGKRLIQMANDIADYFASEPDRELAITGMALHLERFWEPRMLARIRVIHADGGNGLHVLANAAIARLSDQAPG